jgi:hypothetical protein
MSSARILKNIFLAVQLKPSEPLEKKVCTVLWDARVRISHLKRSLKKI